MERWIVAALLLFSMSAFAAPQASLPAAPAKTLRVGVVVVPPFVKKVGQAYEGFVPAIWQAVANRAGLHYKFVDAGNNSGDAVNALHAGKYDALIGPVTVTAPRLLRVSFSRPFYVSKLSAVTLSNPQSFWAVVWHMVKAFFAWSVLVYLLLILAYALIHWALERRHGVKDYQGGFIKTYFFSFWVSFYSFLTGNYERSAESPISRTVMIFWMFVSLIFVSQLIATITSAITISNTSLSIDNGTAAVKTLYDRKVAVQKYSYAEGVAGRLGADVTVSNNLSQAFGLLAKKKVNIVLGNYLTLKYFIKRDPHIDYNPDPIVIGTNEMAFVFPKNSPLRETVSEYLVQIQDENMTYGICRAYLDAKDSEACVI
jgi:polar amino acid transport system substrate-binding protein